MTVKDNFILEEYKSAVELTFHIDTMRNQVTSFYLSFATIVSALVYLGIEGKMASSIYNSPKTITLIFLFLTIIGLITTLICARLRYVQLEHFYIINRFREYCISNNPEIQNVFVLSKNSLRPARLFSGTYYFVLLIMFPSSLTLYFAFDHLNISQNFCIFSILIFFFILNILYLKIANFQFPTNEKLATTAQKDTKEHD